MSGFDYGPFASGQKVLVYHQENEEWYIDTVQEQDGDNVYIEIGCPELGYMDYEVVDVSECLPINHSDVAKMVSEYEKLQERLAELDNEILEVLKKKSVEN